MYAAYNTNVCGQIRITFDSFPSYIHIFGRKSKKKATPKMDHL